MTHRPKPDTLASVSEAAENGTRLDLLIATRARVAKAVDNPDTLPRDLAALTKRLMEIVDDIATIEAQMELSEDSVAAAAALPDDEFDGTFT